MNDRIAFIGCGKISYYHADVLVSLGKQISAVSYKSNIENAKRFSIKYGVDSIYNNWRTMINEGKYDVLWVVPSWTEIDMIFQEIISLRIPAFFEKPVALSSKKIEKALIGIDSEYLSKITIGYNRRFYQIIAQLKEMLSSEKVVAIVGELPETVDKKDQHLIDNRIIQNSSHFYDLIFHLAGGSNYVIKNALKIQREFETHDHFATFIINSIPVSVSSVWNSPQNYSIKIYTESEKVYLINPFEELNIYKGFDVVDPTETIPIRKYIPKRVQKCYEHSLNFKPGFYTQANDLFQCLEINRRSKIAHKLEDSLVLVKFLEEMMSFVSS